MKGKRKVPWYFSFYELAGQSADGAVAPRGSALFTSRYKVTQASSGPYNVRFHMLSRKRRDQSGHCQMR